MVAILLADGFEEIEAVTPIDFLRRAQIQVVIVGVDGDGVRGAHGITVATDISLADYHATPEYLILPGGMPGAANLSRSTGVSRLLMRTGSSGGVICAICAAPVVVLAPGGYLDGKRFTCHPAHRSAAPATAEYCEESVVVDGALITSRGVGTAAEFSAEIIARISGRAAAREIMHATVQPTA